MQQNPDPLQHYSFAKATIHYQQQHDDYQLGDQLELD
jgi:hypothetical protein